MDVDGRALVIGETIEPQRRTNSRPLVTSHVLAYKADAAGLVHQVFRYPSWIGLDCLQWRTEPFTVRANTATLTCLFCIAEAVRHGR